MAVAANAASIARMHDSGRTVDPNRDISHHYRPHTGYSGSHHGGNLYAEIGGSLHSQQSSGSTQKKKKSLPRNYSDGALVRAQSLGQNPKVRALPAPLTMLPAASFGYYTGCCQPNFTVPFSLEQIKHQELGVASWPRCCSFDMLLSAYMPCHLYVV